MLTNVRVKNLAPIIVMMTCLLGPLNGQTYMGNPDAWLGWGGGMHFINIDSAEIEDGYATSLHGVFHWPFDKDVNEGMAMMAEFGFNRVKSPLGSNRPEYDSWVGRVGFGYGVPQFMGFLQFGYRADADPRLQRNQVSTGFSFIANIIGSDPLVFGLKGRLAFAFQKLTPRQNAPSLEGGVQLIVNYNLN